MSIELLKVDFGVDLIEVLADEIMENSTNDLSSTCVIFPGRRASFFLFKRIAERLNAPFYPPVVFSIEDFVKFLFEKKVGVVKVASPLDKVWMIYEICRGLRDTLHLPKRFFEDFSKFFKWGYEFVDVIEELDKELVGEDGIKRLKEVLSVGERTGLEDFLFYIDSIRMKFHEEMKRTGRFSIPYMYWDLCVNGIPEIDFSLTLFAGFYSLTRSEIGLIKRLGEVSSVKVYFQIDDSARWRILSEILKEFNIGFKSVINSQKVTVKRINLYRAHDLQGEVLHLYTILKDLKEEDIDKTVVVLPRTETLIPVVVDALSRHGTDGRKFSFNVSMGYPSHRTHLYLLFDSILKLQESRENSLYRVRDYLNLLEHPYITGLSFHDVPFFVRNLLNSLRNFIAERLYIFVSLEKLENEFFSCDNFKEVSTGFDEEEVGDCLKEIHNIFIRNFEGVATLKDMVKAFKDVIFYVMNKSKIRFYPLAPDFVEKYLEVLEEMENLIFSSERFDFPILGRLFRQEMMKRRLTLPGVPVEGMQVLGLLETRALSFQRVIMLDVNEGVIPASRKYDPILNPVYRKELGLRERPYRKEEEIYRYHFFRLINGAEEVHLIYTETPGNSRSRFIEEIIWEKEKSEGRIIEDESLIVRSFKVHAGSFSYPKREGIPKSDDVMSIINSMDFNPTAIDSYIMCPVSFYFRYILKLSDKDIYRGDIDRATLGEVVHHLAREVLKPYIGEEIPAEVFKNKIIPAVDELIEKHLPYADAPSEHKIMMRIVRNSLCNWFKEDAEHFKKVKILSLEELLRVSINVNGKEVNLSGRIDRVDEIETEDGRRVLRVIDYKTGRVDQIFTEKEGMTEADEIYSYVREKGLSIQIPVYLFMFYRNNPSVFKNYDSMCGIIFALRKKPDENNYKKYEVSEKEINIYKEVIEYILAEILNKDKPFQVPSSLKRCDRCQFSALCGNVLREQNGGGWI